MWKLVTVCEHGLKCGETEFGMQKSLVLSTQRSSEVQTEKCIQF